MARVQARPGAVADTEGGHSLTPAEVEEWRRQFPITRRVAYLNHAVVGPLPEPAVVAVAEATRAQAAEGSAASSRLDEHVETVRRKFAALVGADADEIALTKSTSAAISILAAGLPWRHGDSVVLSTIEFPANVFPWLNVASAGINVRRVPPRGGRVLVDDLLAATDRTTRAVAISLVQFSNGYRCDVAALGEACRARGVLLVVDAMQAVGALAFDVRALPVDALAAASHKWLLGPFGVGWLYLRRDLIEQVRPALVGFRSVTPRDSFLDHEFTVRADARRFEDGVPNFSGICGVGASLELMARVGMKQIDEQILRLTDRLVEGLAARRFDVTSPREKPDERSGIVTFRSPRHEPASVLRRLEEAGVVVSAREGALRASPHFYNTEDEIDRLLDALPA